MMLKEIVEAQYSIIKSIERHEKKEHPNLRYDSESLRALATDKYLNLYRTGNLC